MKPHCHFSMIIILLQTACRRLTYANIAGLAPAVDRNSGDAVFTMNYVLKRDTQPVTADMCRAQSTTLDLPPRAAFIQAKSRRRQHFLI